MPRYFLGWARLGGMSLKQEFWVKALAVALFAFVTAAALSAYLKPGMLIEFANLVLCS